MATMFTTFFNYLSHLAVTDVSTIISDFLAQAVTNGHWTNPSGNTFQSPNDSFGRFISVTFTRNSQTSLTFVLTDSNNNVYPGQTIFIDASNEVRYFVGDTYFHVDSIRSSNPEGFGAGILDREGELSIGDQEAFFCYGFRNAAGSTQSNSLLYYVTWKAGAAVLNDIAGWTCDFNGNHSVYTSTGSVRPQVAELIDQPSGAGNFYFLGRAPQLYVVPSTLFSPGSEIQIPIDSAGTLGTFKVLAGRSTVSPFAAAMRKA